MMLQGNPIYFRNFVFGVEDSLVSTVGLLSGIAIAGVEERTIFLTGVVLILVEAFSMAAGSFLSETSAQEYAQQIEDSGSHPLFGGVVMFFSYFVAGFIPLFPYILYEPTAAFQLSIIYSLAALFLLGMLSGALARTRLMKNALRMLVIGGVAIGAGVLAGIFLS
ncbi:MAG: VIT1/CCC1 transporter family protein [Patescibacteria group bacterium]